LGCRAKGGGGEFTLINLIFTKDGAFTEGESILSFLKGTELYEIACLYKIRPSLCFIKICKLAPAVRLLTSIQEVLSSGHFSILIVLWFSSVLPGKYWSNTLK
jgi:hypothetical protein